MIPLLKPALFLQNKSTVKIRKILGAYSIFEVFIWALIQGGRLLGAGRIMIFLTLAMKLIKKKVIMILYFFLKTNKQQNV